MAINLIKYNNDIDIALAISGIAGPGGSLLDKPIGLVHHALATKNNTVSYTHLRAHETS